MRRTDDVLRFSLILDFSWRIIRERLKYSIEALWPNCPDLAVPLLYRQLGLEMGKSRPSGHPKLYILMIFNTAWSCLWQKSTEQYCKYVNSVYFGRGAFYKIDNSVGTRKCLDVHPRS